MTLPTTVAGKPARTTAAPRSARGRRFVPWLFLIVPLLFALVFKFLPLVEGVRMSFFRVQPLLGDEFIGFDNYSRVVGDSRFQEAFVNTVLLGFGTTVGAIVVGFFFALLFEGSSRRLRVARTAVFLPVVTAIAVIGEIWRMLYMPSEFGFLNTILGAVGIPAQPFLSDPNTALLWVGVVGIWTTAPYNMVIILAGLAGIDRTLYEAAAVDGATLRHRIVSVVLPGLRASLSVVLTLAAIRSLRVFTEVFVLTGGGPAGSTEVWMTRIYSLGFATNNLGVASAASMLLLAVTVVLTVVVRRITANKDA